MLSIKPFNRFIIFAILIVILSFTFTIAAAQEPVTIDVWTFSDADPIMTQVREAFQAAYPHITVQVTDIPEDDYSTKLDLALLAGEPPDVAFIYDRRLVASESFLPLNDAVAAQNINLDDMNPAALAASNCLVDGQVYCLGSYTGAVLLFYNRDMFDAAGIPYPPTTEALTIDEYADIARQLTVTSDNIEERVWGGDAQYWFMDWHNYFSDDVRTAVGYLNDEATAHAFQTLSDLVAEGSLLSTADRAQFDSADLVATGQLATMITDNAVAIPRMEAAGINWGATAPPRESADAALFADQWTDGLGVPAGSDQPAEAALFVTFWGTTGGAERLKLGDLSLNLALAEELNWAGDSPGRQEVLEVLQVTGPRLFFPNHGGVLGPIEDAYYTYMLEDRMPAQEALDEAALFVQEELDQTWETWEQLLSG